MPARPLHPASSPSRPRCRKAAGALGEGGVGAATGQNLDFECTRHRHLEMEGFGLGLGGAPTPAIKFGGLEEDFHPEEHVLQFCRAALPRPSRNPPIPTRTAWFQTSPLSGFGGFKLLQQS